MLAILVTALAGFVIGALWYGPLFSKAWMKASGAPTGNMTTAQTVRLFASAYVLNVVIAFGLAILIGDHHSLHGGLHTGFFVSVMFMATAIGVTYLFERKPAEAVPDQRRLPGGQLRGDGRNPRRLAVEAKRESLAISP